MAKVKVRPFDSLIIVDMQNDFMPGGALPVPKGDEIVNVINEYISIFSKSNAFIVATRDWHPPNHVSFNTVGGPWPPHCIQGTWGAEFHPSLALPANALIVSKATRPDKEAYSGFEDTDLNMALRRRGVKRLFICGVATDYCVKATALDGIRLGFQVFLLIDAVKGVNIPPGSEERAVDEMLDEGAVIVSINELSI